MEREQAEIEDLTRQGEDLLRQISMSGYEQLKEQQISLNELVERLGASKARWEQTAGRLKAWETMDALFLKMFSTSQ